MEKSQSQIRVIFFGTSDFAVPVLEALTKGTFGMPKVPFVVSAIITQPDKPAGRKGVLSSSPVKIAAKKLGMRVLQPQSLKNDKLLNDLEIQNSKLNIDLGIVVAYGKIIPEKYLEISKYGFVNIHPSLLPKYRGPSPIQTAILNGDSEIGVTIMKVDEQMDHGDILAITNYELRITNYYKKIEEDLARLGAKLLIEILPQYINGKIKPKEQDHKKATFTKMLSREDGRIKWNRPAEEIYNQIRALNPEPGTWTLLRWKSLGEQAKILNIKKASLCLIHDRVLDTNYDARDFGTVVDVNKKIAVKTADGCLVLETVQLEGKKEMTAIEFVNGHRNFVGTRLG